MFNVIDDWAKIVPWRTEVVPSVAELPTCQKMFLSWQPPLRTTWRPDVVVSEEAIWKMKTPFALPWQLKVKSPEDMAREEVDL